MPAETDDHARMPYQLPFPPDALAEIVKPFGPQRVVVLRDGRNAGTRPLAGLDRQELIEMMVGRELAADYPRRSVAIGPPRLVVSGLARGQAVRNVSFAARRGEILAIAGLVGSGRTETLRLIFGADLRDAGEISIDGRRLAIRSPRDAIAAGIGLLTEDRKLQGLVLAHSIRDNFALPNLDRFSRLGFLDARREQAAFAGHLAAVAVLAPRRRTADCRRRR